MDFVRTIEDIRADGCVPIERAVRLRLVSVAHLHARHDTPTLRRVMSEADTRSDDALIAAINKGGTPGEAAFATLYHRHKDWAVSVARRFTRDEALALDAMQEAFVYVIRKTPGLRLTCRFRTFLYPAIRNCAIAIARKHQREAPPATADGDFAAGILATTVDELARTGMRDEVATAVASLDDAHREVLIMRIVDELSVEEVALALGVPAGTIKSRLHHAVRRLRDAMEREAR